MIAPVYLPVPAKRTGPIQAYLDLLARGLVERGHAVSIFGPGNSASPLIVPTVSSAPGDPFSEVVGCVYPELEHAVIAYDAIEGSDFDVVHDHTMAGPVIAASRGLTIVHTLHRFMSESAFSLLTRLPLVRNVAMSDSQARLAGTLPIARRIYSAVDLSALSWSADKERFVLFMGRMNEYKGAHRAIDVAREAGYPIKLLGRIAEPAERRYFEQQIEPRLGDDAVYLGEGSAAECNYIARRASAVLFPVSWDEPFGLVMAEAAAAGTPVVALGRGSVPEIVEDGVSGAVVHTEQELPGALHKAIRQIEPATCRAVAEARFSPGRFVSEYLAVYEESRL